MIRFLARVSRRLPIFRGKYRLLRSISATIINKERDITVRGRDGISYLLPNINEVIGFSIYINGVYEQEFSNFIIKHLPVNGVFIDAGANIGSICIPVARKRPDVTIIAIEASPKVFKYLEHNVKSNGCSNIHLVNKALSDIDGASISFYSPDNLFGKGSMSPVFTNEAESVTTITIDSLVKELGIQHLDLMKIDVEGYEKKVFCGMNQLFDEKRIGKILFEFVDWAENAAEGAEAGDAQEYLRYKGFSLYLCDGHSTIEQRDILKHGSAMILAERK